jgi:predicted transport protein
MAKSPEEMANSMIANMKEKTGKTLEAWVKIAAKSGEAKHGGIVKYLKAEHGMTHGFANLVAHKTLKSDAGSVAEAAPKGEDALVDAQYAGDKAALKPIYDAVVKAVKALGKDVEIAPKKSYVSLRRNKQFALIQPTTKTRVDLGINLKGAAPEGKLEASGSFNSMVSHRVRLETAKDVNADIKKWLKQAYEQA